MNQPVRIHLKQAILVGYGAEARYAKVLIGEFRPREPGVTHGFATFLAYGFVHGYRGHNLERPTRIDLDMGNVLAIEDCKVERCCDRQCTCGAPSGYHTINCPRLGRCNVHKDGCEGYAYHQYRGCPGPETHKRGRCPTGECSAP